MWNESLVLTWVITLCLAVGSLLFCALFSRTWISAALGYWSGWLFLLGSTIVCDYFDWNYRYTSIDACRAVQRLHIGATLGFISGSLLAGPVPALLTSQKSQVLIDRIATVNSLFSRKLLVIVFLFGSGFLVIRVSTLGDDISLRGLRGVFLKDEFSLAAWIATHAYLAMCALTAICGVRDGILGVKLKPLLAVVVVSSPLGLANAGRIFLLQLLIVYISAFSVSRAQTPRRLRPKLNLQLKPIILAVAICSMTFAIIGAARNSADDVDSKSFNPIELVLGWPASSMAALDSWLNVADGFPRANGALTFEWLARNVGRLGLVDSNQVAFDLNTAVTDLKVKGDAAAFIPKTIIPELVMDFGAEHVTAAIVCICLSLQFLSIRFRGADFFGPVITAMAMLAAFLTVQGGVGRPDICVVTFWTGMFSIFARNRGKHRSKARDRIDNALCT